MKVWVIEAFSAEPYSNSYWVHSVWETEEQALKYLRGMVESDPNLSWHTHSVGPFGVDAEGYDEGYFLCLPKDYSVRKS